MKTNRVLLIVLSLTLILIAAVAFAQQAPTKNQSGESEAGGCPHMKATIASLDKLQKTLAAGNQSNDPAQMKSSLEEAQTELAEARKEMSMCPMMSGSMMHNHPGEMGDMDHEMMVPDSGDKK